MRGSGGYQKERRALCKCSLRIIKLCNEAWRKLMETQHRFVGQPNQRNVLAITSIWTQPISCHHLFSSSQCPRNNHMISGRGEKRTIGCGSRRSGRRAKIKPPKNPQSKSFFAFRWSRELSSYGRRTATYATYATSLIRKEPFYIKNAY